LALASALLALPLLAGTAPEALEGRSPRAFTALLLELLCLPLLCTEAHAQTTTLVSNHGNTNSGTINAIIGTKFTTRSNSEGYTISSIDIYIINAAPVVTIRADGTDPTGTVIATLTPPATVTANTVLAANATYWLRVDGTSASSRKSDLGASLGM